MGVNIERDRLIGQTTRSGQTNRGKLLSRHNPVCHRLIAHASGLASGIRHGEDATTGDMR